MRNNNRDIRIGHLVERSERRRHSGFNRKLNRVKEREAEAKKMEEFRVKQVQLEQDGGEWVEVHKGIRVFVKDGDDKDAKIAKYRKMLGYDTDKTLTNTYRAQSFDQHT